MNDYAPWLEANDRYLAGALADMRARLERAAQRHDTPPAAPAAATALMESAPAVSAPAGPKHSWVARIFSGQHAPPPPLAAANADEPPAARPLVAAVPDDGTAAAAPGADEGNHTPALAVLANRLGLCQSRSRA